MKLLEYKNYYVFEDGCKKYLFDSFYMECVEIRESLYYALKKKDLRQIDKHSMKILNYLKNNGRFFSNNKADIVNSNNKKIYISLAPVTKCNLRCKYCFANYGGNNINEKKEFDSVTLEKIADYFINTFNEVYDFRLDFLSGGEPLLDVKLLEETLKIFRKKFINKNLEIFLCTNGTLLNENACKILDKYNVNLGISIDGSKEQHNLCRIYENGLGTYDDLYKNYMNLKNNMIFSNHLKSIWSLAVITSKTKSLVDLIKNNKKIGFSSIQMKLVRLKKNNELVINESNINNVYKMVNELVEYFYICVKNNKIDDVIFFVNDNDYFGKIIKRLILKEVYVYRCHAGKEKFAITPVGDIYPCDSFVGMKRYVLGNVYRDYELKRVFNDLDVDNRLKCKSCWCRYVCGGDCLHNSLCTNGDVQESDEVFCLIVKHTIKKTLVRINDLEKCVPDYLNNLRQLLRVRYSLNKV